MDKFPIIHVTQIGNIGNRMLQYIIGRTLQKMVPSSRVIGYHIPGWNIISDEKLSKDARTLTVDLNYRIDLGEIAYYLNSGIFEAVDLRIFGKRLEHMGEADVCRAYFAATLRKSLGVSIPDDHILISVRGAEILGGLHKDYMPLPLVFYENILEKTGLKPVFMGQLDDSPYCQALRHRFPKAEFMPGVSPVSDFNTITFAKNVVCSISTFCWLAAWMSPVAESIHLPAAGVYHPIQRSDVHLLPIRDERYKFYYGDPEHWTGSEQQLADFIQRREWFAPISHDALAEEISRQLCKK